MAKQKTSEKPYREGFLCSRTSVTEKEKKRIYDVLDTSGMTMQTFAYSALMNECEKYETACREGKLYKPTIPKKTLD